MREEIKGYLENLSEIPEEVSSVDQLKRRIGKFHVSRYMIDRRPLDVLVIFRDLLVVKAQMEYDIDAIEYVALGPCFDEVSICERAPEYKIILRVDENGETSIERWERC